MQRRASAFNNYTIEAPDGNVGYISDILFEDNSWKLRWFVINPGSWLSGRRLLIHPAALGRPDVRQRAFPVSLTRAEFEASPDASSDPPLFRQMEQTQEAYYAYSTMWDVGGYGDGGGLFDVPISHINEPPKHAAAHAADPHLRSLSEVVGYHIHALDGDIGHLEDFLVDDETWQIEYAVVDTNNWWFGKHVLVAPPDIKSVDWGGRYVYLEQTRYQMKCGQSWQEPDWSEHAAP